jgi:uncharacterized OB-fold protein
VTKRVRRYLMEENQGRCMDPDCGWDWSRPCKVEVDHENGDPYDHKFGNVRVLCPNCHSMTKTYKGRNRGKGRAYRRSNAITAKANSPAYQIRECADCGKRVGYGSEKCRECFNKNRPTVIDWPTTAKLQAMVEASNTSRVSKELGVSYTAVKRRLRRSR